MRVMLQLSLVILVCQLMKILKLEPCLIEPHFSKDIRKHNSTLSRDTHKKKRKCKNNGMNFKAKHMSIVICGA